MGKGIVFAGNLIVDYVKNVSCYPPPGMLATIFGKSRSIGGCAANTAIDIARIDPGIPVKSIGIVGDDDDGRFVLDVLRQNGVDVASVIVSRGKETSYTDVISDSITGERTFFHSRGANAKFSCEHIDFTSLNSSMFHIGYALLLDSMDLPDSEYGTVMAKTLAKASDAGMLTSMDVVSESGDRFRDVVIPCLRHCDHFIINELEASLICSIEARDSSGRILNEHMEAICKKIIALGVRKAVVVHAPEAGWYLSRKGEWLCLESLKLPAGYIKGSVGAGDAYCAGILYSIHQGLTPREGMRIARAAAAANLSEENTIDGMRSLEETLALEKEFDPDGLWSGALR